jgi:Kef-type K+ transport system membrane component KefB
MAHFSGTDWSGASVLGIGLALSSTAIVLPMLGERDLLGTVAGRDTFAVLLFQDLAFIPLVAVVPEIAGGDLPHHVPWIGVTRAAAAVVVILLAGRFLIRPAFRAIGVHGRRKCSPRSRCSPSSAPPRSRTLPGSPCHSGPSWAAYSFRISSTGTSSKPI